MLEEVYQPLGLQYNCALVSDDHTQVMIEVQHCVKFIIVFYEAIVLGIDLKLVHIRVISVLSYQTFNHPFKIYPPSKQV